MDEPAVVPGCLMCGSTGALTDAEADEAVTRIGSLVEKFACPAGRGWHLRIRKATRPD